jgi:ABC-2 type transport system permease protein
VLLSLLVTLLGMLGYGVPFPGKRTLAAALTVLVGALALTSVALPFTRLVKKSSAAVPMTTAITLTLFFLSGNFFPGSAAPSVIRLIANLFPVRHFFTAELTAFNPNTTGWGFAWANSASWRCGGSLDSSSALDCFVGVPRARSDQPADSGRTELWRVFGA